MNREEAKILAPIIAAFGEGKDITLGGSPLAEEISFDDSVELYEIKPEPEVIWVNKLSDFYGGQSRMFLSEIDAHKSAPIATTDYEYIAKKFIACE